MFATIALNILFHFKIGLAFRCAGFDKVLIKSKILGSLFSPAVI
jgi:hypothetical protein